MNNDSTSAISSAMDDPTATSSFYPTTISSLKQSKGSDDWA